MAEEKKEQFVSGLDLNQKNQLKRTLLNSSEGRCLLVGVALAFVFTLWLGINLLLSPEGSQVLKHHIRKSVLEDYRDHSPRKTKRPDHRHKYLIYIHDRELDLVINALIDAGLEGLAGTIQPANKRKPQ